MIEKPYICNNLILQYMKYKENIYQTFQRFVKDKDTAVTAFMENALSKTRSAFVWSGLPETIPQNELERYLQENGNAFITKVGGDLYALNGSAGGECDAYNRPTLYTVANPYLKISANYRIGTDGVYIENDSHGNSLLPIIGKYAVLYTDGLISLNAASILTRITMLISAQDDKTYQSANEFLSKIINGDFSIIGESAFFDGVKMQTANTTNTSYINQLIELIQYYRANMLNDLGLNANYNMKRERLNLQEVSMNIDCLLPYVDNMLLQRTNAARQINEMYGTDISVDLGSSWKLERENYERQLNALRTPTTDDSNYGGADPNGTDENAGNGTETPETDENEPENSETDENAGNGTETDENEETEENK